MSAAPGDLVLRLAGFRIKRRPFMAEAVWERDGRSYPESQARALAAAEKIEEDKREGRRK